MAGKKKFGFFAGVFTPSILTILGVIMYMRLGWVVGNAGLIGTIIIILIAHVIAVSTGLSVSSVATDKKIGAGGIYYVLSRSMGVPIGGSIGIALYVGTAFSIALYLIGFAESFNGYFDLGMTINDFRITGTIALVSITALALISTSVALKAQFFILAAIIISLLSIFFGTMDFAPQTVNMFASDDAMPLETVFAIFFPAVTGFTAGIAMSGDLKDPKKSIPIGTLLAIGTGLIVYIGLAVFMAYTIDSETLKSDYNILMKIAYFAPAVVAGIWGATLSSALGGILGGPRILQAMSLDSVTPKIFGKGKGKDNEPVNALILVFIIAEAGILIGELDVIARVVSMFYLAAYGFINISYYLESWANPDFQPTFKIKRWIGLVGAIACFGVMFKLDMIAMFGAFAVIGLLYFWLQRKQIQLQSNDVWQSVWSNVVNKGLKKLEAKEVASENWNPNILLFSGDSPHRTNLLEFSKVVSGRTGIVTDFNLVENSADGLSKNQQAVKDDTLEKLGIYGRKIEVDNHYSGIENIASTYGFTGVEPNTVMMNWSRTTKSPEKYVQMTQKLIHLDYNLLYLDYDDRTHFGDYQTIDLWWRETDSNNAEMMLNISRYISQSPEWSKAKIRILFVNHNNADNTLIKTKILNLTNKLRIDAEIKVLNNGVEQKSFYKIIELQSAKTDLIILGIPNIAPEKQADYILNTDNLFETVGTTLLVKASNNFNELDLIFAKEKALATENEIQLKPLVQTAYPEINDIVFELDSHLSQTTQLLADPALTTISSSYSHFISDAKKQFERTLKDLNKNHSSTKVAREIQAFINHIILSSEEFKTEKLPEIEELLKLGIKASTHEQKLFLQNAPKRIKYKPADKKQANFLSSKRKVYWQDIVDYYFKSTITKNTENTYLELGVLNYVILNKLAEGIKEQAHFYVEKINTNKATPETSLNDLIENTSQLFDELLLDCARLKTQTINLLNNSGRNSCIEIIENIEDKRFYKTIKKKREQFKSKALEKTAANISSYSTDWLRNQTLAHQQLQSDFNLTTSGLAVFVVNEMIRSRSHRMTINTQLNDIKLFATAVDFISENLETGKLDNHNDKIIDKLIEGIPHINLSNALKYEEDKILAISANTPKLVHLMSADSLSNFQNCQNEDIEAVEVSLANIQNHIIQSAYLSPLQDSLNDLEEVFKKNAEELYNSSNLINYILTEPITAENLSDYKNNIVKVQKSTQLCLEELTKIEASFTYNLGVHIHNTLSNLNIVGILESLDSYDKISTKSITKSKYQKWFDKQKNQITKKYTTVSDFIIQRKRDVDSLKFIEKHNQHLNNIEQAYRFINVLSYREELENDLSFYYKKLFTGSHLGTINPVYRKKELSAISKAVTRINSGVNGGIIVLGEAAAGKTYFIESIANSLGNSEKFNIKPPAKQNFDVNDVHLAFQNTFGKSGTAESILNQMNSKSILIFDDLENWWVKASNGSAAINYLSKLIEKFGSKHYFILSANLFSYDIIRKSADIEKQILSNIIVPPMSRMEMKEVLMNRHRTGGAVVWHNNQPLSESKKLDLLFNDIYNKSKGNIGVALTIWISSLKKDDDGSLLIQKSNPIHFPKISNPNWKALLYQFAIHNSLTDEQIKKIYGDTQWVYATLNELEKSALIYKKSNTVYAINNTARYFIEEWLKDLKILNE
jgi:amino acid transporter